ncbi:MAG: hypothetical protein ACOYY3_04285 [Chloroflexota bacterium]
MRRYWFTSLLLLTLACRLLVPGNPAPAEYTVIAHPDGPLYAGDRVSFEVLGPGHTLGENVEVVVSLAGDELGRARFGPFGVGGRRQATLWWAWDTRGFGPGSYTLDFSFAPGGPRWQETVELADSSRVPPPEPEAAWASLTADCCVLHYITGTEAERDLAELVAVTDEQAVSVAASMRVGFDAPVEITFMPRVLGHGGFADAGIYVSYLDQNYTGDDTLQIVEHEMVHILDRQLGGQFRPTMFVEGLAVYVSGGHYKPEPLMARAAALLELGRYIPITSLANDFYHQQHEIGYLEAGALVGFMVESYGWEAFDAFYRRMEPGPDDSQAIDAALQKHFGITFVELEQNFLAYLEDQVVSEAVREDLRLTILQFDTLRRYQQRLDPSAYFLTAWLPDGEMMRQRDIVADLLRRPRRLPNQVIEYILAQVDAALGGQDFDRAEALLDTANTILDLYDLRIR